MNWRRLFFLWPMGSSSPNQSSSASLNLTVTRGVSIPNCFGARRDLGSTTSTSWWSSSSTVVFSPMTETPVFHNHCASTKLRFTTAACPLQMRRMSQCHHSLTWSSIFLSAYAGVVSHQEPLFYYGLWFVVTSVVLFSTFLLKFKLVNWNWFKPSLQL